MQMSETPELRRRTVGRSETPEIVSNETKESNSSSTLSIYLNAAIEKAPENLKPAISHVVPFILLFASFVEQAIPIVYSVYLKCLKVVLISLSNFSLSDYVLIYFFSFGIGLRRISLICCSLP